MWLGYVVDRLCGPFKRKMIQMKEGYEVCFGVLEIDCFILNTKYQNMDCLALHVISVSPRAIWNCHVSHMALIKTD